LFKTTKDSPTTYAAHEMV